MNNSLFFFSVKKFIILSLLTSSITKIISQYFKTFLFLQQLRDNLPKKIDFIFKGEKDPFIICFTFYFLLNFIK